MTKVIQYAGADLYPKQREAIFAPERLSLIEASTKAGKSVGCLAWLFEQASQLKEGQNVWWVAPVFSQSEEMFRRLCLKLPKGYFERNLSKLTVTLVTGATIWFKSANHSEDLYGADVYAAVLDEASRMGEDAWHAVRSTISYTRGPVRMIGNVRGRNNWFYRLCREAEKGAPGMAYHRITWEDAVDAGVLDRSEIEDARRDFSRLGKLAIWDQLYNAVAVADDENPFGHEAIADCVIPGSSVEVRANGEFVWDNPEELWPRAAGVDLAGVGAQVLAEETGTTERDYTAVVKIDRAGIATHVQRFRLPHTETQERVLAALEGTMALVDMTGQGSPQVEAMQRRVGARVEGYNFNVRTRQDLLDGLALAISSSTVAFPDGPLRDELDAFEYRFTKGGVRFEVSDGEHDDCVMALALAVKRLPWRRSGISGPIGVSKRDGSIWTPEGATARAEPSLTGDQQAQPDPSVVPEGVPVPILVNGGGACGSKWRLPDR